jgi:hypothetical protein
VRADPLPTPEQVEARIAEVAALNRLCESLAEAGRSLHNVPAPSSAGGAERPVPEGGPRKS